MKDRKLTKFPTIFTADTLFLSLCGIGFSKHSPGSMAALIAIPFILLIHKWAIPTLLFLPVFILAIVGSSVVCQYHQRKNQVQNPPYVVIDAAFGMFLCWSFAPSSEPQNIIIAFALFRLFAFLNPWPSRLLIQRLTGGAGVVLDGIVHALYAGMVYYIINYLLLT